MKTAETKSAAQQHNTAAQSFFNQGQEQAFFSEHVGDRAAFFPSAAPNLIQGKFISGTTPFFASPAPATLQRKCTTCEAEEVSQTGAKPVAESPTLQRMPAFESEGAVQAKAVPGARVIGVATLPKIASPPANSKSQPASETKEPEQPEEAIAGIPQLQMMPAFSSADDSGDGEDGNGEPPPVQFRLTVGQPGDVYEREADAMADRVAILSRERAATDPKTLTSSQPQQVSRKPESLVKPSEATVDWVSALKKGSWGADFKALTPSPPQRVSRKPESLMMQSNGKPSVAPKQLESRLQQAKGSGTPLDADTRTEMEDAFSSDFSGVQIHTGQEASSLNQSLNARAFTHRNNIFFNTGEYQPQSAQGKHLLAHELTHTIQQGNGVQRKVADSPTIQTSQTTPAIQRVPDAPGNQATVSSEVVDITTSPFKPSDKVKGEIEAQGDKGLDVRTIIKSVTSEGRVKVKLNRQENYDSIGKGSMPLLNDWAKQLGGMYINFSIKNNEITGGYASLKEKGGDTNDWLQALKKNSSVLGGLGLKVENLPTPVNKLENGKLTLGVNDLKVEVGGFVDAQFNLLLENTNKPKIDAIANINVKGVAKGTLKLDNTQEKLTGEVALGVDYKAFSGEAKVTYKGDGTVDIAGKAAYNANKLSGEIQFVATDLETANRFAKDAIAAAGGKENVQDAPPPAPVPAAKSGSKERALAATGQLGFNLTTWFAGTVNVVVDGKGDITVIGKIAPPAEIELFKQRDWEKEIITFEARAYYGIPLVGNLNVFANIGLYALAKLGPAKIYNIEILGTYSTDPTIQRSIQISGSLNISAYAGLRLRAEGGAGIEIIGHDLRFGVGLNADVGVKAYADARPTIGYRDPGVFFISGTLEMVAQPMLGLGGDFFIELDSPWWSPAPDKKWIWPLFSKEWPLTDPIGLNAVVKDYELGSGKVPEVEFKKPEFDPSKFMTNMVDNKLPDKSGGKDAGQGTFKEDGSVPKPTIAPKKPEPKKADAKPSKKGTPLQKGKSANPDPKAENAKNSMKILADAAKQTDSLKAKAPFTQADLNKELTKVKGQVSGVDFSVKPKDQMWAVTPKAGDKTGKPFELGAKGGASSATVKESFSMGPASHTLTAILKDDTVIITMASMDDIKVSIQLGSAIDLINNDKEVDDKGQPIKRDKTQKNVILSTLKAVKTQVDNIRPPRGEEGVNFDTFIKPRLAVCIGQLSGLAKYKPAITSLKPLIVIGQPRYIPRGFDIRGKLYDATTGGEWDQLSKKMRGEHVAKLGPQLYKIWQMRDDKSSPGNYAKAEAEWNKMQSNREIPSPKNAPTFASYDHPKHFNRKNPFRFTYETDHDPSLGTFWNSGEKNKDDSARKQTTLNEKQLRVITWEENNERAHNETVNPRFKRDVGPDFSSDVAFSPKGSMTIDGKPFDDKPSS